RSYDGSRKESRSPAADAHCADGAVLPASVVHRHPWTCGDPGFGRDEIAGDAGLRREEVFKTCKELLAYEREALLRSALRAGRALPWSPRGSICFSALTLSAASSGGSPALTIVSASPTRPCRPTASAKFWRMRASLRSPA